ncbi:DUF4198 domain-containing protein [Roseobacter weihaiensis]|uniref:DUF4198 domain-containing protein n=1 Tax=Roseobacter weihaiensis TaxID=2763262 RepID=UPI001D0AA042|nr:DUF4198 domain-containing protein [Roseobacter sp. H9]
MGFARLSIILALFAGAPALAHEFWIEPEQYQVESGAPVIASLKNGQKFKGVSQAYFENRFTRFETIRGETVKPVDGRLGDSPALQTIAPDEGLLVIVHETTPSTLTYQEWEKFLAFVAHKDFRHAVEHHEAKGWPKQPFRERYTRHVKALIAVGSGAGKDQPQGLATEFIARTNPYLEGFDGTMRVELHDQGRPRADAQVEVFEKSADGAVEITLYRTDANGLVAVPVRPGHSYLFDAVVLREAPAAAGDDRAPLWQTLWAALTFAVPAP